MPKKHLHAALPHQNSWQFLFQPQSIIARDLNIDITDTNSWLMFTYTMNAFNLQNNKQVFLQKQSIILIYHQ